MANKKRKEKMYERELGTFDLRKKDILALEDIISKHMVRHDDIRKKQFIASRAREHDVIDKSTYSDRYIELNTSWFGGRHISFNWIGIEIQYGVTYPWNFDSISDVQDVINIRYLRIVGMPGVFLTFSPLQTKLIVRRQDAGVEENKSMDRAITRIEAYLNKHKSNYVFNKIFVK